MCNEKLFCKVCYTYIRGHMQRHLSSQKHIRCLNDPVYKKKQLDRYIDLLEYQKFLVKADLYNKINDAIHNDGLKQKTVV